MPLCLVRHIDAFSDRPGMGNPAGVVADAESLDEAAMQRIAKAVGFNETVFILPSAEAEHRFRFFTPGHEMPLCGHATVAAVFHLGGETGTSREFAIETLAGVLPVSYDAANGTVTMRQAAPRFRPFTGSTASLAEILGVGPEGIRTDLPAVYGNTGTWTLLVPTRSERTLQAMNPDTGRFPDVLREMPRASVHPFVVTQEAEGYDFSARHFSSPYSGTIEDPVTGTASGVMGAYAMRHLFPNAAAKRFVVAQGQSVGRDGQVYVDAVRAGGEVQVSISGQAAMTGILSIEY